MQKTLLGKKAVITGSTTGIGMAVARALAREGCDVMLSGLGDMGKIEFFRAALMAEFGIQAFYNEADLRHAKEASGIINDAQSRLGGIDILVNNASLQQSVRLDELSLTQWQEILSVNAGAAFHTTRQSLPLMRKGGFGRIVNIASVHGMVGRPRQAALAAGNHALIGLTKVVALETAAENITCNVICPGFANTDSDAREISKHAERVGMGWDEAKDYLLGKRQPNKRLIETEEVAELVINLCAAKATGITGAVIPVDGGWTAQ
jgi:3-hydroxybutyrate dehydrogenase